MSKDENIYAALSGFAGLTDIVGARIFPLVIPQDQADGGGAVPSVVYQRIAETRFQTLADAIGAPARSLYQFTAWARMAKTADEVRHQVELALSGADFTAATDALIELLDDDTRLAAAVLRAWIWD